MMMLVLGYKKDNVLRVVSLTYLFLMQIYVLLSVLQLDYFTFLLHYIILCRNIAIFLCNDLKRLRYNHIF